MHAAGMRACESVLVRFCIGSGTIWLRCDTTRSEMAYILNLLDGVGLRRVVRACVRACILDLLDGVKLRRDIQSQLES